LSISGGNEYTIFDKSNKIVKEIKSDIVIDPQNRVNPSDQLDIIHIANFLDAIQKGTPQAVTVEDGHKCTLLMQLANISLRTGGRTLDINPDNGRIVKNKDAEKYWSRKYEKGWEPKV
jgi:hypothetical protein